MSKAEKKNLYYKYQRKERLWTDASVAAAVAAYNNKEFSSINECAKHYHMSKAKLFTALKVEKGEKTVTHQGRKPVFTIEEEQDIAGVIATMARSGFPITNREIPLVVKQYADTHCIETPWTDNVPGKRWTQLFRFRNKLVVKKASTMSVARHRALRNPFSINGFYDTVEAELDKMSLRDRPHLVFNCDESGFPHDPSKIPVITRQGEECLNVILGAGRENTTVLACCSADGTYMPPFIIFKGTNKPDPGRIFFDKETGCRHDGIIDGTDYAVSENGWIDAELFYKWFTDQFLPHAKKGDDPILLLFDGHLSHVSVQIIKKARESNVTILKLPPHTSSVLQPLDVACFGPVKRHWQKLLMDLKRKKLTLSKDRFTNQVGAVWKLAMTPQNIQSGFSGAGILPFNRGKYPIPFDPVLQEKYDKWINDGKPDRQDGDEYDVTEESSGQGNPTTPTTTTPVSRTQAQTPVSSSQSVAGDNDDYEITVPPKPDFPAIPGYPQPTPNHVAQWNLAWMPMWVETASADNPQTSSSLQRTPVEKEAAFHKAVITTLFHSGPPKKQRKINLSAEVITGDKFYQQKLKKTAKTTTTKKKTTSKNPAPSTSKNSAPSTSKNSAPSTSKNSAPSTSKNSAPSTSTAIPIDSGSDDEDGGPDLDVVNIRPDPAIEAALEARDLKAHLKTVWLNLEKASALNQFYAVYYSQKPYIGKIVRQLRLPGSGAVQEVEMKFLFSREEVGGRVPVFIWPKREDVETVSKTHVFAGPLTVEERQVVLGATGRTLGSEQDVNVADFNDIKSRYLMYKRHIKEVASAPQVQPDG